MLPSLRGRLGVKCATLPARARRHVDAARRLARVQTLVNPFLPDQPAADPSANARARAPAVAAQPERTVAVTRPTEKQNVVEDAKAVPYYRVEEKKA